MAPSNSAHRKLRGQSHRVAVAVEIRWASVTQMREVRRWPLVACRASCRVWRCRRVEYRQTLTRQWVPQARLSPSDIQCGYAALGWVP